MTESTYLKMNKPEYSDQFDLAHWNENTDVVDNFYNDLVNIGSVKANKAVNDDAGNKIFTTYATKTELNTAKSEIDTSLGQKELSANKVSAWQSAPDDTHYPSEKLVKDGLDGKANASHTHTVSQITDLLSKVYPVGSLYLSVVDTSPASFIGGTWEKLPAGYALWTATSGAGNTIAAGLPNIKGHLITQNGDSDGKFVTTSKTGSKWSRNGSDYEDFKFSFNAAGYNSIYSDSVNTVQPPAYKVYVWKRTA